MHHVDLSNLIKSQQPFEPVRIRMSNGATFDIRHPDAILIGPRTCAILVGDAIYNVTNEHISSVEPVAVARG